jgi:hypothetical protein
MPNSRCPADEMPAFVPVVSVKSKQANKAARERARNHAPLGPSLWEQGREKLFLAEGFQQGGHGLPRR